MGSKNVNGLLKLSVKCIEKVNGNNFSLKKGIFYSKLIKN